MQILFNFLNTPKVRIFILIFVDMKRVLVSLAVLLAAITLSGQEKESAPKKGWVFTPMPDFSYNSDLGVNLGAFCDFFYYGDGTIYPNFHHHIAVAAAWATKGAWYVHGMFDSHSLVPGARVTASLTFRDASANNFYGFNGIAAPFDETLDANRQTRTAYYNNHKQVIRAAAVAQREGKGQVNWMGGLVFRHIRLQDYDLSNYNSGNSLWLAYQEVGLIRADEAHGGSSLELKGGFTYDTRDVELFPGKGIYGELYLNGNLDLSHKRYHYAQVVAHFRHFVPIIYSRLTLAYHIGLQHQFLGEMPYYNLSEISTLLYQYEEYEGLGSRYTIRGYKYDRILAPGIAWANIELRATCFKFDFLKQHIALILMPFMDLATITRTYRPEEQKALPGLYQDRKVPIMLSGGIGGAIHINANMTLGIDFGKALDPQLNDFTIGMHSTYMF
jgi:outer membrane protein assembly factor BamA